MISRKIKSQIRNGAPISNFTYLKCGQPQRKFCPLIGCRTSTKPLRTSNYRELLKNEEGRSRVKEVIKVERPSLPSFQMRA